MAAGALWEQFAALLPCPPVELASLDHRSDPRLLAGYDAAQRHIADGSYHVALGASGTPLPHTVAVSLGERFFGE